MHRLEVTLKIGGDTGISVSLPLHPEGIDELGEKEAELTSSSDDNCSPEDGRLPGGEISSDEETNIVTNSIRDAASSDVDSGGDNAGQRAEDTFAGSEEDH